MAKSNLPSMRALCSSPAIALLLALATGMGCTATIPQSMAHSLAGAGAPEFEAVSTAEHNVRVPGRSRTRVTVVGFWASWCATCQAAMPVLADLWRDKREKGLMVIGVSLDESESSAVSMARELRLSFPIVFDAGQRLASMYRVSQVPLTFVVDGDGQVRWVGRDPEQARQAALALLAE